MLNFNIKVGMSHFAILWSINVKVWVAVQGKPLHIQLWSALEGGAGEAGCKVLPSSSMILSTVGIHNLSNNLVFPVLISKDYFQAMNLSWSSAYFNKLIKLRPIKTGNFGSAYFEGILGILWKEEVDNWMKCISGYAERFREECFWRLTIIWILFFFLFCWISLKFKL